MNRYFLEMNSKGVMEVKVSIFFFVEVDFSFAIKLSVGNVFLKSC